MRWFKLVGIAVGILIAFLVVGTVIGAIFHILTNLVIAALVVGAIVVAIKVARSRRQVSAAKPDREVREPDYSRTLPRADVDHVSAPHPSAPYPSAPYSPPARPAAQDVDDDLARLKREMGG